MENYLYAVISRESGKEISFHETMTEVYKAIEMYEQIDRADGEYEPDYYDWKVMSEQEGAEDESIPEVSIGDNVRIIHLSGEDGRYDGRVGIVQDIDDIGQLHGTWGGLAIAPEIDNFELLNE